MTLSGSTLLNASRHGMSASKHGLSASRRGTLLPRTESFSIGSMHTRAQAANESFMVTTKEFLAMVRLIAGPSLLLSLASSLFSFVDEVRAFSFKK